MRHKWNAHFFSSQHGATHAFEKLIASEESQQFLKSAAVTNLFPISALTFSLWQSHWQKNNTQSFDLIITGTSLNPENNEEPIWQWAKSSGIPCFAYHDQWVNTEHRFRANQPLPDAIFVVDDAAKKLVEALNLNLPIYIMGSPLWDDLEPIISARRQARSNLVVFASEPAAANDYKQKNGFDDLDCLSLALKFFSTQTVIKDIKFEILLHPIDSAERIEAYLQQNTSLAANMAVSVSKLNKSQALAEAGFITGMRSMLLVEASLIGIPVISFQPNRLTASPATDRDGIQVATDLKDVHMVIEKARANIVRLNRASAANLFKRSLDDYLKTFPTQDKS